MIDVEIKGPVAKKEYEKLKKTLETAGENIFIEEQVIVSYTDRGFNNRAVRLEHKNDKVVLFVETGKIGERKEIVVPLARESFSAGIAMLAELGYKKATVSNQEVFSAEYGGALFSLFDPDEETFYYEASISAGSPDQVKEAKKKLEKLARNFKLPMWSPLDMLEFNRKLSEKMNFKYDYDVDGAEYFRNRFMI